MKGRNVVTAISGKRNLSFNVNNGQEKVMTNYSFLNPTKLDYFRGGLRQRNQTTDDDFVSNDNGSINEYMMSKRIPVNTEYDGNTQKERSFRNTIGK